MLLLHLSSFCPPKTRRSLTLQLIIVWKNFAYTPSVLFSVTRRLSYGSRRHVRLFCFLFSSQRVRGHQHFVEGVRHHRNYVTSQQQNYPAQPFGAISVKISSA